MNLLRLGLQLSSALVGALLGALAVTACSDSSVGEEVLGPGCYCPEPRRVVAGNFPVASLQSPISKPLPLADGESVTLIVADDQVRIEYDRGDAHVLVVYAIQQKFEQE